MTRAMDGAPSLSKSNGERFHTPTRRAGDEFTTLTPDSCIASLWGFREILFSLPFEMYLRVSRRLLLPTLIADIVLQCTLLSEGCHVPPIVGTLAPSWLRGVTDKSHLQRSVAAGFPDLLEDLELSC